ncbi:GNAT family N-acetyltransferase [Paenarthrobacter aromaticivorans]|uniref:GNAT family N-acetyltransferase n=1 Tax=Paenarthrobacter aromaticivorans TaxID=2849150 RepID=UPI003A7F8481
MQIREAALNDLRQVEAICDASGRARWAPEMIAPVSVRVVLVAIEQDEIVGIAKTHFHGEPEGRAPAGHYLGGVIITPNFRRRGIASALTRVRLDWIWSRSSTAYYFANEHNTASIRMHETLGFQSIGRFGQIRGVTADDGRSKLVLFQASQ